MCKYSGIETFLWELSENFLVENFLENFLNLGLGLYGLKQ